MLCAKMLPLAGGSDKALRFVKNIYTFTLGRNDYRCRERVTLLIGD